MAQQLVKWPAWMKYPTIDGYGVEPQDRRVKTDMEVGSTFRVEFDTDETTASCSLFLNPFQSNWFEAFERSFLAQGSKWFIIPLWVGGQLVDHTVRFRERPKLTSKHGPYSTYAFTLDLSKREDLLSEGNVAIFIEIDPFELYSVTSLLQIIVNINYPKSLPYMSID
jgi:hypothetical protein